MEEFDVFSLDIKNENLFRTTNLIANSLKDLVGQRIVHLLIGVLLMKIVANEPWPHGLLFFGNFINNWYFGDMDFMHCNLPIWNRKDSFHSWNLDAF